MIINEDALCDLIKAAVKDAIIELDIARNIEGEAADQEVAIKPIKGTEQGDTLEVKGGVKVKRKRRTKKEIDQDKIFEEEVKAEKKADEEAAEEYDYEHMMADIREAVADYSGGPSEARDMAKEYCQKEFRVDKFKELGVEDYRKAAKGVVHVLA